MRTFDAVLFDFTGTLFWVEGAHTAVVAALGESYAHLAPALQRWSAINGSDTPDDLPAELADVWAQRDLSRDAHRAAYSGLAVHAGLAPDEARVLYDRGISTVAWHPHPDTVAVLRQLRDVPVALVSNIGWDPRPVLAANDVADCFDTLVLSDERGVLKPDERIFRLACTELGVPPERALMIGDNPVNDGAATATGCAFVLVDPAPNRAPDTLLRALS